ncbi:sodium:proton antiporter [Lentibacillus cibarius]|uniref:Sodium:proton antiporter n=1 Tax=Lentibacillus cibarius TaxID=2583219 RepID=A0A549YJP7_9BACI|nr:sodium:proton antiporter [Lentibacillus cibarius]TRM12103.1 sodium:proton antiporter [Lentibacillus cibarius]
MEQAELLSIVIIIVLGIFSQWLAWRIQWPSIVIMSVAGLLIGPVLGLINPEQALGELYTPLISLAVAVVLYEGSSSLNFRELKGISKSVLRVVTAGAFLAWIGGAMAAHYIAGLNFAISFIIGGLFIVTGPTVIIPLLRQAKLKPRVATVLKWEGIIIDPVGPLLALFAYQVIKVIGDDTVQGSYLLTFFIGALLAGIIGFAAGIFVSRMIRKGLFPEFLKSPIVLSFVLLCFTVSEVIMHETGMLAVTVMGMTMAKTKKHVTSIGNVSHFVENISVILTSTIFVLLTASLTRETILEIFTFPIIGFVLMMLLIVRPLSIWISTIGTEMSAAEKTLIGWIAPRGIVALTVAGYFASVLAEDGYAGASILMTITFALVFITVCAHGFTLGPLAKKLNLASNEQSGILIIGANHFSITFADYCQSLEIPVLMIDDSYEHLLDAKQKGINTFYGQILSEYIQFEVDLTPYDYILAMTDEPAYNALICQSYAPEFGYNNTFALPASKKGDANNEEISPAIKGHVLFHENAVLAELSSKLREGYTFDSMKITEQKTVKREAFTDTAMLLFIWRKNKEIAFMTLRREKLELNEGDRVVMLTKQEAKNENVIQSRDE